MLCRGLILEVFRQSAKTSPEHVNSQCHCSNVSILFGIFGLDVVYKEMCRDPVKEHYLMREAAMVVEMINFKKRGKCVVKRKI